MNAIDYNTVKELRECFKELSRDGGVGSLILTSGREGVFSAGLDLMSLCKLSRTEMKSFFGMFLESMAALATLPMYTVTAINGHSPAGGCVYSIMTDYRLMSNNPQYTIGLNETAVGVILPAGIHNCFSHVIGPRNADLYGFEGRLMHPEKALEIGLVDELCPPNEIMDAARKKCNHFHENVVFEAFVETKKSCKQSRLSALLEEGSEERTELWVDHFMSEPIQKAMAAFAERLKKRK